MRSSLALLTVAGKDRPGIIATVTQLLFQQGCNLEDVSMTILEGEFSMMMIVSLKPNQRNLVQKKLEELQKKSKLTFFWKALDGKRERGEKHHSGSVSHLIIAIGRDRTGIVYKISQVLAAFKINITDLNSRILGHGKNAVYAMMLEADIPKSFSVKRLDLALRQLQKSLGIEISIKPVERLQF